MRSNRSGGRQSSTYSLTRVTPTGTAAASRERRPMFNNGGPINRGWREEDLDRPIASDLSDEGSDRAQHGCLHSRCGKICLGLVVMLVVLGAATYFYLFRSPPAPPDFDGGFGEHKKLQDKLKKAVKSKKGQDRKQPHMNSLPSNFSDTQEDNREVENFQWGKISLPQWTGDQTLQVHVCSAMRRKFGFDIYVISFYLYVNSRVWNKPAYQKDWEKMFAYLKENGERATLRLLLQRDVGAAKIANGLAESMKAVGLTDDKAVAKFANALNDAVGGSLEPGNVIVFKFDYGKLHCEVHASGIKREFQIEDEVVAKHLFKVYFGPKWNSQFEVFKNQCTKSYKKNAASSTYAGVDSFEEDGQQTKRKDKTIDVEGMTVPAFQGHQLLQKHACSAYGRDCDSWIGCYMFWSKKYFTSLYAYHKGRAWKDTIDLYDYSKMKNRVSIRVEIVRDTTSRFVFGEDAGKNGVPNGELRAGSLLFIENEDARLSIQIDKKKAIVIQDEDASERIFNQVFPESCEEVLEAQIKNKTVHRSTMAVVLLVVFMVGLLMQYKRFQRRRQGLANIEIQM